MSKPLPPESDPNGDDLGGQFLARRETERRQLLLDELNARAAAAQSPRQQPTEQGGEPPRRGVLADLGHGFREAPRAIANGILDAAGEAVQTLFDLAKPIADRLEAIAPLGTAIPPGFLDEIKTHYNGLKFDEPETVTGNAVKLISQFTVGFVGATKALNAVKAGAGLGGTAARNLLASSLAEAAVFDEQEKRLANLVQEVPALANPVAELLAADPNDPVPLAKAKQVLEGLGLGLLGETFLVGLDIFRKARRVLGRTGKLPPPAELASGTKAPEGAKRFQARHSGPLIKIDDDFKQAMNEVLRSEPNATPPDSLQKYFANINIQRIGDPADVRDLIARTATAFEKELASEPETFKQIEALAEEIGTNPKRLAALVTEGGTGKGFTRAEVLAIRTLLHTSAARMRGLANMILSKTATDADKIDLLRTMQFHRAVLGQVSGAAREAGRQLNAFRIIAKDSLGQQRVLDDLMGLVETGGFGGGKVPGGVDGLAAAIADLPRPGQLNRFIKGATKGEMFIEAFINGLLSGPKTHIANITGNAAALLYQVPERLLAATIRSAVGGKGVASEEVGAMLFGMMRGVWDGLRAAGGAFRSGEGSDLFNKVELGQFKAIRGASVGLDEAGIFGQGVNLLGEAIRVPGRLLLAADEFFKAVAYRTELQARAARTAAHEGLTGKAFGARVAEVVENPPPDIKMDAVDFARYSTFTQPLGELGQTVQAFANTHPVMKVLIPFVRTPVNIVKFVGARTPLAPIAKGIRADIAAGGAKRDLALARIGLSSLVMGMAADWAASGLITGPGPADPTLRDTWMRNGWRAWSIRIGDKYVSYNRTDPVGMMLGLAAGFTEIVGQLEQEEVDAAVAAMVITTSSQLLSKTWLSTLSDLAETVAVGTISPKLATERLRSLLQTTSQNVAVPFGAVQRQLSTALDPVYRQTQNTPIEEAAFRYTQDLIDRLRDRVPSYSEKLPPRLNLWGEPITFFAGFGPDNTDSTADPGAFMLRFLSPAEVVKAEPPPIDEEMLRLNMGISMPEKTLDGVELTPEEYNEYVRLAARDIHDPATGMGAFETLNAIVTGKHPLSAKYRMFNDAAKEMVIRDVVTSFRELAREKMRRKPRIAAERERLRSLEEQPGLAIMTP